MKLLFPDPGSPLAEFYRFIIAAAGLSILLRPPKGADDFHFYFWIFITTLALGFPQRKASQ